MKFVKYVKDTQLIFPKPYNETLHSYSFWIRNKKILVCTLCPYDHYATNTMKNHCDHKYKKHQSEKNIIGHPDRIFSESEIYDFQLAAQVYLF